MTNFYLTVLFLLASGFSPVWGQTSQTPETARQGGSTKEPTQNPERQLKAQIDDEFKQDILRLLELNGEVRIRYQLLKNAMDAMKKTVPGVKDEFWAECEGLLSKEKLADQLVAVYSSRFSHEEVKSIVAFFDSPAGNKFLQKMPGLISESNGITNKMGRVLGEEINAKLSAAGYSR